jgi:hypothetical protein
MHLAPEEIKSLPESPNKQKFWQLQHLSNSHHSKLYIFSSHYTNHHSLSLPFRLLPNITGDKKVRHSEHKGLSQCKQYDFNHVPQTPI